MSMTNKEILEAIEGKTKELSVTDAATLAFISGQNSTFQNQVDAEAQEELKRKKREAKVLEEQKKEAERQAILDSLGPNDFLLSSLTDGRLPKSGIDWVLTRYPDGTWDEEHSLNIPEIDEYFYWDADVLEGFWLGYTMNDNVLAVGPPGTGKTSAGHQLAAHLRQPYSRFNGKDGIEPASFLGYPWATKTGMEWRDGQMPQSVSMGYYTAVDEIFKLPPGIQMALQSLYEKDGYLMLDEKPGSISEKKIMRRQEFRILGADNTKGTGDDLDKYGSGQMQDISTLDRFGLTVPVDYLPVSAETKMLERRFPNVDKKSIKRSVAMANLVRTAFLQQGTLSLTMSPRGLCTVCEALEKGVSLETALRLTYINKLSDDSEVRVATKFLTDTI